MKQSHKRIFVIILLTSCFFLIRFLGFHKHITLETIRQHSQQLQNFIQQNYFFSVLSYIALLAGVAIFSIPISPFLILAAGYFFGVVPGTLFSIVGSTLGATLAFCAVRYLLRGMLIDNYSTRLKKFDAAFQQHGANYLLCMQLLPITPFGFITFISGLSTISWWTFVWTTAVGITPGCFIYACAGRQLMTINKLSDILSWPIMLALAGLAAIALLPLIAQRYNIIRD